MQIYLGIIIKSDDNAHWRAGEGDVCGLGMSPAEALKDWLDKFNDYINDETAKQIAEQGQDEGTPWSLN